jgi:hypothetical protein
VEDEPESVEEEEDGDLVLEVDEAGAGVVSAAPGAEAATCCCIWSW